MKEAWLNLIAAPITGILLALSALTAGMTNTTIGLPIAIPMRSSYPPGTLCVEFGLVIVRIDPDKRLFLNTEPVNRAALQRRLREIFSTRAERVVFVLGAPELNYGDVVKVIDAVQAVIPNVGILTPTSEPTLNEPLLNGRFPVTVGRTARP